MEQFWKESKVIITDTLNKRSKDYSELESTDQVAEQIVSQLKQLYNKKYGDDGR